MLWILDGEPLSGEFGSFLGPISSGGALGNDLVVSDPGFSGVGNGRIAFVDGRTGLVQDDTVGPNAFSGLGAALATHRSSSFAYVGDGRGRVYTASLSGGQLALGLLLPQPPGVANAASLTILEDSGQLSLVVGRRFADVGPLINAGTVEVFPPGGGSTPSLTMSGASTSDFFGTEVMILEDLNGDGARELGIRSQDPPFSNRLRAFDLAGNSLLDLDVDLGTSASLRTISIGDATGDGRGQWIVGTPNDARVDMFSAGLTLANTSTPGGGFAANFAVDLGPANAGATHLQLYGGSGTIPGTVAFTGNPLIPLNLDNITTGMLGLIASPILPNAVGSLDANGRATTDFVLDPLVLSILTGITWTTTVVRIDTGAIVAASNPITLAIP